MQVTDEDKRLIEALLFVLDNGRFSLNMREASALMKVRKWAEDLKKRFEESDGNK